MNQNLNEAWKNQASKTLLDPPDVASQYCEECEGMGIIFHAISNEDFDVEICTCIPDDVDFSELVMGG